MSDPFKPIPGPGDPFKKAGEWTPIVPVPDDAPPPPAVHPKLRQPTETYAYRGADGRVNGYVMRFEHVGGKEFRPLTFCRHPGGVFRDWRWTTWRKPRPLFNADKLHTRSSAPVLIVEGEKSCLAAERLAPGHVCITSPGGSKAAAQADWTLLNGRKVVIWPDNDDPGRQYAAAVANLCGAAGAAQVSVMEPPEGVKAGWDAADAVVAGFDETQIARLIAAAKPMDRGRDRLPRRDQLMVYIEDVELWHDDAGNAYATFPAGRHRENALVQSTKFTDWLSMRYWDDHGASPSKNAMGECLSMVEARARLRGKCHTAFLRVAEEANRVFIDLCNDDWQVIECSKNGWRVINNPPMRFIRREGMLPLPIPEPVTEQQPGIEELRKFFLQLSQAQFVLLVVFVMSCYHDDGAYPILAIGGEAGDGKSFMTRVLVDLIDPRIDGAQGLPKDLDTLSLIASKTFLPALENISRIPLAFSDALCRIASGEVRVAREFYTNTGLVFLRAKRPVIINGIPHLAEQGDLASRTLEISLPHLEDGAGGRDTEAELWKRWREGRPRVFAGVLDGICSAMRNLEGVKLAESPRLVGALRWATAAEGSFGFDDGEVFRAFQEGMKETIEATLEADIVALALLSFIRRLPTREWEGTATALLTRINECTPESQRRMKSWPTSPTSLSNRLKRAAQTLRSQGVHIRRGKRTSSARPIMIVAHDPA